MSKEILFGGGYSGGKSFKVFNEFVAVAKTGKSVKYVAKDWIAMDMKTYKAERTQLLSRVREAVGKEEKPVKVPKRNWHGTSYLGVHSGKASRNKLRKEILKKLEIISEEVKE